MNSQSQSIQQFPLQISWKEVYEAIDQDRIEKISLCPFISRVGISQSEKQIDKKYVGIFFAFIERILINYTIDYIDEVCRYMDSQKKETNCKEQIDMILNFIYTLKKDFITEKIALSIEEFIQFRQQIFQLIENDQLFKAFIPFAVIFIQSKSNERINQFESYNKDNVQKLSNILKMNIKVLISKGDKIKISANKPFQNNKQKFDKTLIIVDRESASTVHIGYDCANERLHRFCYLGKIVYEKKIEYQQSILTYTQTSQSQSQIQFENNMLKESVQKINDERTMLIENNQHLLSENNQLKETLKDLKFEISQTQNNYSLISEKYQNQVQKENKLIGIFDQMKNLLENMVKEQTNTLSQLNQVFSQQNRTPVNFSNYQQQLIQLNNADLLLKQQLVSIVSSYLTTTKLPSQQSIQQSNIVQEIQWITDQKYPNEMQQSQIIMNQDTLNISIQSQIDQNNKTKLQALPYINQDQLTQQQYPPTQIQQINPYAIPNENININPYLVHSQSQQGFQQEVPQLNLQNQFMTYQGFNQISAPNQQIQFNTRNTLPNNFNPSLMNNDNFQSQQLLNENKNIQLQNKQISLNSQKQVVADVHTIKMNKNQLLMMNDVSDTGQWTQHQQIQNHRQKIEDQECPICCSIKKNEDFFQMKCGHQFCSNCLKSHINALIAEGKRSFNDFTCLHCKLQFDPIFLYSLLTIKQKNQIDEYYKNKILNFKCPNQKCGQQSVISEKDCLLKECFLTNCCKSRVCSKCKQIYHPDSKCESQIKEMIEQIGAYRNGQKNENSKLFRFCPICYQLAFKDEGCDHVQCIKCKCDFCFNCSAPRPSILAHGNHYHRQGCNSFFEFIDKKTGQKKDNEFDKKNCTQCKKTQQPCKRPKPWEDFITEIKKEVGPEILEAFPDNFYL